MCFRTIGRALLIGTSLSIPASIASAAQNGAAAPNILLIVADDLGWKDVGWHGAAIKTPNLDHLVRTGVELDEHYVQPVCTPTRVALLTGRYPSRFGPHCLRPTNLRALPPGTETIATTLGSLGYTTYLSGKWHLGARPEWGPRHYGFQFSYGSMAGAVDPWQHTYRRGPLEKTWHRDGQPVDEPGNATELVAQQAVRWLEQKRAPWFLYVPFQAVHIPVDAPEKYMAIYRDAKFDDDPKRDESYRRFAAFVSQLDAKVGDLVAALDRTGQRERTLIIFTSDNGGLLRGENAYVSKVPPTPRLSSNDPLRGEKATLYEGGIRVCAFANWSGRLQPRKVTTPMHAVDWFPTLAALVGYKSSKELQWDGKNFWPQLAGQVTKTVPRTIYWPFVRGSAVRQGDWKLIESVDGRAELFDLANDPYEKNDRADQEPKRVEELKRVLLQMRQGDRTEIPADLMSLR